MCGAGLVSTEGVCGHGQLVLKDGRGGCQNDLQLALRHHLVGDSFLSNWTEDPYCLGDEGACEEEPITRPPLNRKKKSLSH